MKNQNESITDKLIKKLKNIKKHKLDDNPETPYVRDAIEECFDLLTDRLAKDGSWLPFHGRNK